MVSLYSLLLCGAFVIVIGGVATGSLPAGTLVVCCMLPKAWLQIKRVNELDGAALNAELAGTAKLSLGMALLLAIGVIL